jgi:hypothetical protein
MTLGSINIWLWVVLFALTLLYEGLAVLCTLAVVRLRSILAANLSVLITATGMVCVLAYAGKEGEINNCIPILLGTWLGNVYILDREKKKRAKEESFKKSA